MNSQLEIWYNLGYCTVGLPAVYLSQNSSIFLYVEDSRLINSETHIKDYL